MTRNAERMRGFRKTTLRSRSRNAKPFRALGHGSCDIPRTVVRRAGDRWSTSRWQGQETTTVRRSLARTSKVIAKSAKTRRATDDPIDAGNRNLQERRGGVDVAVGEVNRSGAFIDIER
jgi:hypothetical protein